MANNRKGVSFVNEIRELNNKLTELLNQLDTEPPSEKWNDAFDTILSGMLSWWLHGTTNNSENMR